MSPRIPALLFLITTLLVFNACSDDDEGPVSGNNNCVATGNGSPPVITMVSWTQAPGCNPGTPSLVTIDVAVADSDTAPGDLTYVGSISSCTGAINSSTSVFTCPQAGTYAGEVRVTDPQGNCDRVAFSFGPCQSGSVVP
ncbi:MAG: hypothetical protein O7D32_11080 [bacterium]|nr:hypothetical protein [bacterium]